MDLRHCTFLACQSGNVALVKLVLLKYGAHVQPRNDTREPYSIQARLHDFRQAGKEPVSAVDIAR